jgi:NTP pyrophosphatase (non-canonical NTP hydrolase)
MSPESIWNYYYIKPNVGNNPLGSIDPDIVIKNEVLNDISVERERQYRKWGVQEHDDLIWLAILTEEVGEVSQAILQSRFGGDHAGTEYTELVEAVSVGIQWLEHMRRKKAEDAARQKPRKIRWRYNDHGHSKDFSYLEIPADYEDSDLEYICERNLVPHWSERFLEMRVEIIYEGLLP